MSAGGYLAALFSEATEPPRACRREDYIVQDGFGVGFGPDGSWFFFTDIELALTFGRAARMALECNQYGVYQAVHELMYCPTHHRDERVLHLVGDNVDRTDDESNT